MVHRTANLPVGVVHGLGLSHYENLKSLKTLAIAMETLSLYYWLYHITLPFIIRYITLVATSLTLVITLIVEFGWIGPSNHYHPQMFSAMGFLSQPELLFATVPRCSWSGFKNLSILLMFHLVIQNIGVI